MAAAAPWLPNCTFGVAAMHAGAAVRHQPHRSRQSIRTLHFALGDPS
ncbi:hypothetical protein PLANPX_5241 [Lacipirellula parvula]|uniref:Uncharacterized protein n=1 Tax=Lacipirellula parvula TaxID=2650471 RepID=A0A5K7XQ33_9BACT|nr:hypothetical protein PLANPX_5241 [Lacipirellula parvula]